MKREALQVGLPQGATITRHHHQDAPALAQEVLDQDGAYALWSVLHASGKGEHHYVARDANGNIHGLLTGSEDGPNHFMHDLRTSQNAPAGIGAAMVQAAARDAKAGNRRLRAMGVMDSARHWWEAMGLKLKEGDENGEFAPDTLDALLAGNTVELPNTKVYKHTPMGDYPVSVDPDTRPWIDPARRAPGSARALQVAASTIEAAQRLLAGAENDLQDVHHLQKDDLEQYFADQEPPKPTPPVHQPARDILNEWLKQRGNRSRRDVAVQCPSCRGTGRHHLGVGECNNCDGKGVVAKPEVEQKLLPWAERLENALYDEFKDWWPTSKASRTRSPETVRTKWHDRPNQPLTHWLNIEDFLNERYPEAATGATYGGEDAGRIINEHLKSDRPGKRLDPKWLEQNGYVGWGNPITQAMLTLHNRENGRYWRTKDDRRKYFELMLRHIGPKAPKPRKAASILDAVETIRTAQQILAMPAVDAYDNGAKGHRNPVPEVPQGDWFHGAHTDLPIGTILTPGGGTTWWEYVYKTPGLENRPDWVWVTNSSKNASTWGEHVYRVEPLDEGPWPWNGPEGAQYDGYVTPRARIVEKIDMKDYYDKLQHAASLAIKQAQQILAWKVDPNYFAAIHEMGHVLDAVGKFKASDTLDDALFPVYEAETGKKMSQEPGGHWMDYRDWMRKNIPGRAWEKRLDMYGVPQGFDDFNPKEALAASFVEHELNPDASTPAMRALHQHLIDHSVAANRPTNLTTFRPRAKPPKDIDPEDGTFPTGSLPRPFMDGIQYVFQKYPQSRIVDRVDPLEMSRGGTSPVTNTVLRDIDSKPRIEYDDRAALTPKLVDDLFHREREQKNISPWMYEDEVLAKAAAVLRHAMPMADAYDNQWPESPDVPRNKRDTITKLPDDIPIYPGPWFHATGSDKLEPGTVLVPNFRERNLSEGIRNRTDWTWMSDHPLKARLNGHYVYEVEPMDEGPYPWNGKSGIQRGHYVSPRARIVRQLSTDELRKMVQEDTEEAFSDTEKNPGADFYRSLLREAAAVLKFAEPLADAYDPRAEYQDDYVHPDRVTKLPTTRGKWYHISPHVIPVGTKLTPKGGSSPFFYDDDTPPEGRYRSSLPGKRKEWVWFDRKQKMKDWLEVMQYAMPEIHLYEVKPEVEGPWPWNGSGEAGHVAPAATVVRKIPIKRHPFVVDGHVLFNGVDWNGSEDPLSKAAAVIRMAKSVLSGESPTLMQLHRGVGFQKGELPPEMEQRFEQAAAGQADPNFIKDLLLHLDRDGGGMGEFWAHGKEGPWLAQTYSARVWPDKWTNLPSHYRVLLDADWDGSESDMDFDTDPDYRKLLPGAKVRVRNIKIRTPKHDWIDLGGEPEGSVRYAAVNQDLLNRLHGEFKDWWGKEGPAHVEQTIATSGWPQDTLKNFADRAISERGPVGFWPNVEGFLKSRYPAAHRNMFMGYEDTRPLLDWKKNYDHDAGIPLYETGPEAEAKHGYDPREVVAAMLLLHNQSDPRRNQLNADLAKEDEDRLNEIAQKRVQMQRKFEDRALTDAKTALREAQQILKMRTNA